MGWLTKIRDFFNPSPASFQVDAVVFGLGNPGEKYNGTRHNIGFKAAEAFIECLDIQKTFRSSDSEITFGILKSKKRVAVVKPLTFMNESGVAVESVVKKLKIPLAAVIVLVDDFHIPLRAIRIRKNGSSGGHNGLKSIEAHVGPEYSRLRIGIGPLTKGTSVIDFVLGRFSEQEEDRLKEVLPEAVGALNTFVNDGIEVTMSKFNK